MDSLTHALTGAIIGEATAGSKIGKKAMLIGALAANIPDLDVLVTPFFDPIKAMFVHRGFSHSFLLLIPGSLLIAYLLSKKIIKSLTLIHAWMLIFIPWLSHLVMDIFNTYGTALFEPICSIRVSFDSMAIVDLSLLLILSFFWVAILQAKRKQQNTVKLSVIAMIAVMAYFGLSSIIKIRLEQRLSSHASHSKILPQRVHTTPLPLTNMAWMVVTEDSATFEISHVNIIKNHVFRHARISKSNHRICKQQVQKLIEFTKGYFLIDSVGENLYYFYDLRFSSLEREYPKAYVLQFKIDASCCKVSRAHPKRGINISNAISLYSELF